ncbi:MAG: hypothetical protein JWP16_1282 [Alphaproteobacteria bacterium]|nr:hypothetical protein [Alphaproteobacteria bacterium]
MHYEIGTLSLWIGVGVALIVGGIQVAGWRHRGLIIGLIVAGAFCIIGAIAIPPMSESLPSLARFMTVAASSGPWISVLMFAAALVVFSKPKAPTIDGVQSNLQYEALKNALAATNGRLDTWVNELCQRIENSSSYRENQFQITQSNIAELSRMVAIDMPNASTIAEAFKNLDDAVHSKVNRISEQTQGYFERLKAADLDLKHVLYFSALVATEGTLEHLVSISPKHDDASDENEELNAKCWERNSEFLREVASALSGTYRYSEYQSQMDHAVNDTDRRLGILPPENWPPDVNPVDLRKYFISALQRRNVVAYLHYQLRELRQNIRSSRQHLIERYSERDKR